MNANVGLQREQVEAALDELNLLAQEEYGLSLETLLLNGEPVSELRVQRLVGIALKRKFARQTARQAYSATDARHAWPWADDEDSLTPVESATDPTRELALLEQLRMPGSWNENKPPTGTPEDQVPVSWTAFKQEVEHERGLFKILALYVVDKFNKKETKALKAYFEAPESAKFELGLDLATLAFDWAVTAPLMGLLGIPTIAVGIALSGIQFGYKSLADPNRGRVRDRDS